ncbi:metallophosphoesterase [Rhizobium leguminosarum]|uniref:metallophosphoesterase n=1 Tax=Rhizobium leguminosarum TaxID=384 RepID=UPI003CCB09CA
MFFLGDIIDRGPQSFEAMELVIQTLDELPGSKLLRGNHEDFVLRFLDIAFTRHYDLMNWMWNGGAATALSYGVPPNALARTRRRHSDAIPKMRAALDRHPVHIETMRNAEHMIIERGLVFVHAGLRPEVSLAPQSLDDLMTIRH